MSFKLRFKEGKGKIHGFEWLCVIVYYLLYFCCLCRLTDFANKTYSPKFSRSQFTTQQVHNSNSRKKFSQLYVNSITLFY